jgi:hypothetical protein
MSDFPGPRRGHGVSCGHGGGRSSERRLPGVGSVGARRGGRATLLHDPPPREVAAPRSFDRTGDLS